MNKKQFKQLKEAVNDNNGATLTHTYDMCALRNGYMVSLTGYERVLRGVSALTRRMLAKYARIAKRQGAYIGLWIDTNDNGRLYVDVSVCVEDKALAYDMGLRNKQLSIYDLSNNECIYLQ